MASLNGFRFDITGASGSQGLLTPKASWRAYILPRGGYASQDSTGTLITFDSSDVASRFAANDWIQSGLSTDNIRQVSAVGGDSLSISGAALTVSENDRIFLIGTTQPTVVGGSATYTVPETIVRQRDDDTATAYTNSMITSNSDGLIQGFAAVNYYDSIIQDGNQSNQGSIIDLETGVVGGVSASGDALFGSSVTINGNLGVTGTAFLDGEVIVGQTLNIIGISGNYNHVGTALFGNTVTANAALGVTGTAVFGDTVIVIGTSGDYTHTGWAEFGDTVTLHAQLGVTSHATFGDTVTIHTQLGVTGHVTCGTTLTVNGNMGVTGSFDTARRTSTLGVSMSPGATGASHTAAWGSGAITTLGPGSNDSRGQVSIFTAGSGLASGPEVVVTYTDGAYGNTAFVVITRGPQTDATDGDWNIEALTPASFTAHYAADAPTTANTHSFIYTVVG